MEEVFQKLVAYRKGVEDPQKSTSIPQPAVDLQEEGRPVDIYRIAPPFLLISHLVNLSYQENDARLRIKEIKRSFSPTVLKFSSSCLGDSREDHRKAGYCRNIRNASTSTHCLNIKIKELPVTSRPTNGYYRDCNSPKEGLSTSRQFNN